MHDETLRMNRLTLRFAGAEAETRFADEQARKALKPFRVATVCGAGVVILIWLMLGHLLPTIADAQTRLAVPMLVILAILAYGYARSYTRFFMRMHQLLFLAGLLGMAAAVTGIASLAPRGSADSVLAIALVHTLNAYSILRLRFPIACCAGWGTAAIYLGYLGHSGALAEAELMRHAGFLVVANLFGMIAAYQLDHSARREHVVMRMLEEERGRSERLLLNILPASIAERLKASGDAIAEHCDGVTVLFADIAGFTPLSANKTPRALVELLNRIFSEFDALADAYGLEKIKTIGDAYMAVAGLPEAWPDHAARAARMALAMLDATSRVAAETGEPLSLRIGLHSGPVVAGVIGRRKFTYDLWGDTVNTASRMESHGVPGAIHCSGATALLLQGAFPLFARGAVDIKGKGEMHTFLLTAETLGAPQVHL